MRAGILVLGPRLARYNKAQVSLPGGCAIGSRPVDIHLDALRKMGVHFKIKEGYINAVAKAGLIGNKITFPKISVGATENVLIASCFSKGKTKLRNCASEPEVQDLINFLNKLGCKIIGDKTIKKFIFNKIKIATKKDWQTEYLSPIISVKSVNGVEEAINHINK